MRRPVTLAAVLRHEPTGSVNEITDEHAAQEYSRAILPAAE